MAWLHSLNDWYRKLTGPAVGGTATDPLLTAETQRQILLQVESWPNIFDSNRQTDQFKHGQAPSRRRGTGTDFIENRDYSSGDSPRLINWRASARYNRLQSRVYQDEREPNLVIVLDRRASMRFGTRNQLKLTQAAKLALALAAYFINHNRSVALLELGRKLHWVEPQRGASGLAHLQACLGRPAPVLPPDAGYLPIGEALMDLVTQYADGHKVVLLSDFFDLDQDSAKLLFRLSQHNTVVPIQVLDVLESSLTVTGAYELHSVNGVTQYTMKDLQAAGNQQELKQRLYHIQQMLARSCQTNVNLFTTDQDLFAGKPVVKLMLAKLLRQL